MKINGPGDRNYWSEAESGLSKQLPSNFQSEHSCDRKYSSLMWKNGVAFFKKTCIVITGLRSLLVPDGTIIETTF